LKIGRRDQRSSSISTANAKTILIRGRDLTADLVGSVSFAEHFWLLLTGGLPTHAQSRILDAALVAIAEHGMVPSVQVSRMTFAAAPDSLQGAVAAGILGCGSVILGASEDAGRFFSLIDEHMSAGMTMELAASQAIQGFCRAKRPIPGYGHPLHKDHDPRVGRLFAIAAENKGDDKHVRIALEVESQLPVITGKALALNVSGAIPAVLLDAGFPLLALRGVPILARTAGLIAHLLEERTRPIGFVMSQAAAEAIEYDGEAPPGFQSDEA